MKGIIAPHLLLLPKCPSGLSLESSEELKEEGNIQDTDIMDQKFEEKNKFYINTESQFNIRNKTEEFKEIEVQKLATEFNLDQYPSSRKLFTNMDSKLNQGKDAKVTTKEIRFQKLHEGVPKKRKPNLPTRQEYLEQLEYDQCTFIPEINQNTSNKYYSPNKPLELHNDFIKRQNKLNEIRYTKDVEIEYQCTKSKINKNSIELASKKFEKFFNDQMNLISSSEKINFHEFGRFLFNIGILSVAFNPKYDIFIKRNSSVLYDKYNNLKKQIEFDERKTKYILNTTDHEKVLINQIWTLISPKEEEYIEKEYIIKLLIYLIQPQYNSFSEFHKLANYNDDNDSLFLIFDKVKKKLVLLLPNIKLKIYNEKMEKEITTERKKLKNTNLSPQMYNSFQYEFIPSMNYFPKSSGKNLYEDRTIYNKIVNLNTNEKIMKEMKECTFKPRLNLNRSEMNINKIVPLNHPLKVNSDAKKKQNIKHESPNTQEKEIRVCTFAPKIISDKKYKSSKSPKGFEKSVSRFQKRPNLKLKSPKNIEKLMKNIDVKSQNCENLNQKAIKVDININNEEYSK